MERANNTADPIAEHWASHPGPTQHLILPDGCVDVLERAGQLWVVGPMTKAKWVSFSVDAPRGFRLRPAHVRQWLGVSPEELVDATISALDFASLREANTLEDVSMLAQGASIPPRLRWAVERLERAPNTQIAALAEAVSFSERHFRRIFTVETGLSPKIFGRIQRLQWVLQKSNTRPAPALADLACDAGYTDQAHMSREIKALSGLSPTTLLQVISR